ncbi:MAG TPA: pirin family protein [Sporichthyaceae bacterium]
MSNTKADPFVDGDACPVAGPCVLTPRQVPLGGPRAMTVRRTLPQREKSLIGAWCFLDHYGPDRVADSGGMQVPGHPHTGLSTVSWLFDGTVEHRDTTGVHALVRPGELNLMTAGRGIAHSEFSTPDTEVLHGAQLWLALPEADRFVEPGFVHHAPDPVDLDGARTLVFLGELGGTVSPVQAHSPLLGAELTLRQGHVLELAVPAEFEHGVLVDAGAVTVNGQSAKSEDLVYCPPGARRVRLAADEPTRILLLGGEPLGEQVVMWWNFLGRSHSEIVEFRADWERERAAGGGRRFGTLPEAWSFTLGAPPMPNVRLRPRG